MTLGALELIAGVAVIIVLTIIPAIVRRRVEFGEARFDKDGKLIDDE